MRLVRFLEDGVPVIGSVDEHDVVRDHAPSPGVAGAGKERPLVDVALLPFVDRSATIVCVGLNYVDHAKEAGVALPDAPLLFGKSPNTLLAHRQSVLIPVDVTKEVDYEAELGVVIGRRCKDVSENEALNYVAGYTCVNDVSARDLQFASGQWFRGKSLDTFCPVGPFLTTADEITDPQGLPIRGRINGELRQDSTTANMVFSVAEIVSYISRTITLEPGDLVATGTPAGVGAGRDPKSFLQPGDTMSVEIEGLGVLFNPVAAR